MSDTEKLIAENNKIVEEYKQIRQQAEDLEKRPATPSRLTQSIKLEKYLKNFALRYTKFIEKDVDIDKIADKIVRQFKLKTGFTGVY